MMKNIIFYFSICFALFSCNQSKDRGGSDSYTLEKSDNMLSYLIDENTQYLFSTLFPFIDNDGDEYLTFRSVRNNSILFYNLQSGEYLFDVPLDKEGPNGVGQMTGYWIEDLNNIYITSFSKNGLVKVDTTGIIKQFIPYKKTDSGYDVVSNYVSSSAFYTPMVINDDKIYITQSPYSGSKASTTPLSVVIDTTSQTIIDLPFKYPPIFTDDETSSMLIAYEFGRDFNGKDFIYSFNMDDNIYITSLETNEVTKTLVKSKYIKEIKKERRPDDIKQAYKLILESPHYGNILYDKYRKVYYRFAYPGISVDDNKANLQDIFKSGFPKFSIIILDEDFNIIGETLFPEYIYNPTIAFVHKEGLYISDTHIMNPKFDEDKLSFACFKLINK